MRDARYSWATNVVHHRGVGPSAGERKAHAGGGALGRAVGGGGGGGVNTQAHISGRAVRVNGFVARACVGGGPGACAHVRVRVRVRTCVQA